VFSLSKGSWPAGDVSVSVSALSDVNYAANPAVKTSIVCW